MKTHAIKTVETIASVHPIGAAILFALSFLAWHVGYAAALVVVAFLVGLHFAKRPQVSADVQLLPAMPPALPTSNLLGDAIASELKLSKIEFKAPTAARARKPQTVSAA